MQSDINKIIEIRDIIAVHGQDLIKGMAVIVIGLIAIKWINRALKKGFKRLHGGEPDKILRNRSI